MAVVQPMQGVATFSRPASGAALSTPFGRWADRCFGLFAIGPAIFAMAIIFGVPLVFSLLLSFQGWSIDRPLFAGKFVGLDNYADLLTDPEFLSNLVRTVLYTLAVVAVELAAGLGIALLLNADLPFIGAFRTALIIPMMMTPIVAALCWKLLLDPQNGIARRRARPSPPRACDRDAPCRPR